VGDDEDRPIRRQGVGGGLDSLEQLGEGFAAGRAVAMEVEGPLLEGGAVRIPDLVPGPVFPCAEMKFPPADVRLERAVELPGEKFGGLAAAAQIAGDDQIGSQPTHRLEKIDQRSLTLPGKRKIGLADASARGLHRRMAHQVMLHEVEGTVMAVTAK